MLILFLVNGLILASNIYFYFYLQVFYRNQKNSDILLSSLNHEGEETIPVTSGNFSSSEEDAISGDYDNLLSSW